MINISYSAKLFFILALTLGFGACKKKDNAYTDDIKYTGAKMVSFSNYDGYQRVNLAVGNNFVPVEFEVKLANTTATANGPITVKLIKDDNAIYEYNTINGTMLSPLPIAAYKFEKTEVVIAKGSRTATVRFEVNPSNLPVSAGAFGLSIFSVSGDGAVVHNDNSQTHLVVELSALNKYDGYYQTKGAAYHPTYSNYVWNSQGVFACGDGFALVTSGANSVDLTPGQPLTNAGTLTFFSAVLPRFTVDQVTNKVTITSTNTTVFVPYPTYDSKYDPNAKAFYVKFGWSGDRVATDTFTYCGPR